MNGKLAIGGLVAVAAMALSAGTASAQRVVQHGNHYHTVSPGFGYGGGYGGGFYQPVYQPVYRPVAVYPQVVGGYPWGNFGSPGLGGFGGGYGRPVYGGGYGGGFNTLNVGVYRPGFNANFGFVIR